MVNELDLLFLKGSEDKNKQDSGTPEWTEFDSKVYQNFLNKLEEYCERQEREQEDVYKVPASGSSIWLGSAKITFYGPLENDYQYGRRIDLNTRQENKYSIVCKIVYGNNRFFDDWRCTTGNY